jgi:hypothetical protein
MQSYWSENVRRTWGSWKLWQGVVGFALTLLAVLGYGWMREEPRLVEAGLYGSVVFILTRLLVLTPWSMWNEAQQTITCMEDRAKPKLRLVLHRDRLPFVQELLVDERGQNVRHRTWRVGIQNDSNVVIPNVRVVLQSFEVHDAQGNLVGATPDQPALLEHALNVMGFDNKTGFVDVAPGDRPTAYVDVVGQWFTSDNVHGDWMSPCYASGHRTILFARNTYVLGLRVEGGGSSDSAKYVVDATLERRRIDMRPYNPPLS